MFPKLFSVQDRKFSWGTRVIFQQYVRCLGCEVSADKVFPYMIRVHINRFESPIVAAFSYLSDCDVMYLRWLANTSDFDQGCNSGICN